MFQVYDIPWKKQLARPPFSCAHLRLSFRASLPSQESSVIIEEKIAQSLVYNYGLLKHVMLPLTVAGRGHLMELVESERDGTGLALG